MRRLFSGPSASCGRLIRNAERGRTGFSCSSLVDSPAGVIDVSLVRVLRLVSLKGRTEGIQDGNPENHSLS